MSNGFTKALGSLAIKVARHCGIGWNHLVLIPIRSVFTASPFHNWCWALGKPPGCLCCKGKTSLLGSLFMQKASRLEIIVPKKKKKSCSFINGLSSGVLYPFTSHNCFRDQASLSIHRGQTSGQISKYLIVWGRLVGCSVEESKTTRSIVTIQTRQHTH